MKSSESIAQLAEALAQAQAKFPLVKRDSANPFFKSRYSDLGAIIEAVQPFLAEFGLAILQPVSSDIENQCVVLNTILVHKTGEFISEELRMPVPDWKAQGLGSATTYARRYAIQSMLNVAPDSDDDGNAASTPANAREVVTKKSIKSVEITPEVQALRDAIKMSMVLLNEAGDTPDWTTERVNRMAKENFNGKTTAQLTAPELNDFADMFSQRLETLRRDKAEVPAKRQSTILAIRGSAKPEIIDGYLKTHFDGKGLDELTDAELNQVDAEFSIPF